MWKKIRIDSMFAKCWPWDQWHLRERGGPWSWQIAFLQNPSRLTRLTGTPWFSGQPLPFLSSTDRIAKYWVGTDSAMERPPEPEFFVKEAKGRNVEVPLLEEFKTIYQGKLLWEHPASILFHIHQGSSFTENKEKATRKWFCSVFSLHLSQALTLTDSSWFAKSTRRNQLQRYHVPKST